MGKVMLTVTLDPHEASPEKVGEKLGLAAEALDPDFGVVELDPVQHKYAVLVEESDATGLEARPGVEGPFSNPVIEPFGPPRP